MAIGKQVAYNTFYQSVGRIIYTILSAISIIFLTRYLGTSAYGDYTTITVFVVFFVTWADIGISMIAVRDMSKNPAKIQYIISRIISLRFLLAVIFCGLAIVVGSLLPYTQQIKYGIIISSAAIFITLLNGVWAMIFQTKLVMQYSAIAMMVGRAVTVGLIVMMVYLKFSFLWIVSAALFGSLTDFLLSTIFVKKFIKIDWKVDFKFWKSLLIVALPVGLNAVLVSVYFRADTIILSLIKTSADVGIYGVAYKFLEIVLAFPGFVAGAVFPVLASRINKKDHEAKSIIQKIFDVLLIMALPVVAGTYLLAEPIIGIIGGAQFYQSVFPLKILAFAMGIFFFDSFLSYVIIILNHQKSLIKLAVSSLILNVILNLIFIPKYSYIAAAYITVITQAVVLILMLYYIKKYYNFLPNLRRLPMILLSTVIMGIFIVLFKPLLAVNHLYIFLIFISAMVIYAVTILGFKIISLKTIRSLLPSSLKGDD